jgi:aspartate/methionine/tyrosine aminotransferase
MNPGKGYVRIALVASFDECAEAIERIVTFASGLESAHVIKQGRA